MTERDPHDPAQDSDYLLGESSDLQQELRIQQTLKIYTRQRQKRVAQDTIRLWQKRSSQSIREREMCWRATGSYELGLMETGWRLFKRHHEIIETLRRKSLLSYSKYLKKKYFNEIKKHKELGLKNQEKRVEMMIVSNNNKVVKNCLAGWRAVLAIKKENLALLATTVNQAIIKLSFRTILNFTPSTLPPVRKNPVLSKPPLPSSLPIPPQSNAFAPRQAPLFNFERKYTPVKTLYRSGQTPQKSHPSQSRQRQKQTQRQSQRASRVWNLQTESNPPESRREYSGRINDCMRQLYVRKVEFQFFNDPLFKEEKYARYQQKVKREIIELYNEIEELTRQDLRNNR